MPVVAQQPISLFVRAASGQKRRRVSNVPVDATIAETINKLVASLRLATRDKDGEALTYQARLDREGRNLMPSEVVGDVLQAEDEVVLVRNIDAG